MIYVATHEARLAFFNAEAATDVIPKIAEIMAKELK